MSNGAVAERYAQALFELADEAGELSKLADQIREFAVSYDSNRELSEALSHPTRTTDERDALVRAVAQKVGVSELGIRGLLIMARKGRLPAILATSTRLTELSDEKAGVVRASVTTASKMPESYYQALTSKLEAAMSKKVVLERDIDESLVGGAIARVGDAVVDGSVRGKLERVERDLLSAVSAGSL